MFFKTKFDPHLFDNKHVVNPRKGGRSIKRFLPAGETLFNLAPMNITERTQDGVLILSLEGRLDQPGSDALREHSMARIAEGHRKIVIDFGGISFLASMGIRAIIAPSQELSRQGGRLVVANLGPSVKQIFDLTGLDNVFSCFDTVEAAVANLQ